MMNLMRLTRSPWSVFDELESLRPDTEGVCFGGHRHGGYPLMDVWSSEDGLVFEVELPGVDPKDVDVSVIDDQLTLKGKFAEPELAEGEVWHRRERTAGEFERTLQLPYKVDADGVSATYRNGVLRVTVPKSEEEKARKIVVKAA